MNTIYYPRPSFHDQSIYLVFWHQKKWQLTALPAKSDSDRFCLQSYQGLLIDISLVY